MDILVSSNLERLLYLASGKTPNLSAIDEPAQSTKNCLSGTCFQVMDAIRGKPLTGFATDDQTRETIRSTWEGVVC